MMIIGTSNGLTATFSTYSNAEASTTLVPCAFSTRAYLPLGTTQVSTTAKAMMIIRMTKVWGIVKPFFLVGVEVWDITAAPFLSFVRAARRAACASIVHDPE